MTRRIAVIDRELCLPKKCGHECQRFCPPQITGHKVVEFGEDGANVALRLKAIVDENNQALHQDRREDGKSLHRDKEICR